MAHQVHGTSDHQREDFEVVADYCRAHFPDVFTAVTANPDDADLAVYRTSGESLDPAVTARFPRLRFAFRPAVRSERQVADALERLTNDRDLWSRQGVKIWLFGPQPSGRILVETADPELAAERLAAHYPEAVFDVRHGYPKTPA
ncbi:hypothetical protein [Micromonospora chersina]|uniref:hypothetical protein n=1 Tax=Micromonospora chersina TaxID=47854 RepID=UPI0037244EFB